jgi:DNA invertase Pin-like site-specific DNA recombinase
MLTFAREGDTVVVHSMDRLARNLDDLRKLVQSLTKRGIRIGALTRKAQSLLATRVRLRESAVRTRPQAVRCC